MPRNYELNVDCLPAGFGSSAVLLSPTGRILWFALTRERLIAPEDGIVTVGFDSTSAAEAVTKAHSILRGIGWSGRPWYVDDTIAYAGLGQPSGSCDHLRAAHLARIADDLYRLAKQGGTSGRKQYGQLSCVIDRSCLPPAAKRRLHRIAELTLIVLTGLEPNGEVATDHAGAPSFTWLESRPSPAVSPPRMHQGTLIPGAHYSLFP